MRWAGGRQMLAPSGWSSNKDSHALLMLESPVGFKPSHVTVGDTAMLEKQQPTGMPPFQKVSLLELPSDVIFLCYCPLIQLQNIYHIYIASAKHIFLFYCLPCGWHLVIECLENWTRVRAFFFFFLPFASVCCDVLIFAEGMRQGHISTHTHTHTLITLAFYLTLRVCGYIYKSRQIWNRWSELIQVGAMRPAASWGTGKGREEERESLLSSASEGHTRQGAQGEAS